MTEIKIPIDQPDASFGAIGSRYYGIYRLPHGRWRQLTGHDKQRLYFKTAQEASRAALAKVNSLLFRPIYAEAEKQEDAVGAALAADVLAFRVGREREQVELSKVFRGLGKGFVQVETKRRRGA